MRVTNSYLNKFEIFQEFYYITYGEKISYNLAVEKFYQMDGATKNEFCKYYADKTDYQLVYKTDASGQVILDDDGNEIILNAPYTSANGFGIRSAKTPEPDKNPDGSPKTKKAKGFYKDSSGNILRGKHEEIVWTSDIRSLTQAYIGQKYTIEAYAVKNGLILDPEWSIYSPEEIIQMENEGVNIPQEILDIAHTILEGSGENYEGGEDEEGTSEKTTERESFLELIPKAEKQIEKCNDNREKIDKKVDDMLQENKSNQKNLMTKQKDQLDELKEYEAKIREWRHLQDKINNGEELTDSEAKKYAQITGMLQDRNSKSNDFGLNKNKITISLNEINILAVLGEKLADETIEIADELADYISQNNYKRTRSDVMGEVGILRGIVAMSNGKSLAKEASIVGNEAKEYTEQTAGTISDIAGVLGVQAMLSNPEAADSTDTKESTEVKSAEVQASDGTDTNQTDQTIENKKTNNESAQQENQTNKEDFIINDETVLDLIKKAGEINKDLLIEIKNALFNLIQAKDDNKLAKAANKYIDRIINEYQNEEQRRNQEISEKEQENKDLQDEIDELKGESSEDQKDTAEKCGIKTEDEDSNENQKEIEEKQTKINENNSRIEELKAEAATAKEDFSQKVKAPKEDLAKAIPDEMKAQETDALYKDKIIPEDKEKLAFTGNSGGTLFKMGKYRITVGLEFLAAGMLIPPLRVLGMYHITRGGISAGIGATAKLISKVPTPKAAEKIVDKSIGEETSAIESLNEADVKISSVTGEQTEMEKFAAAQQGEQSEGEGTGEDNGEDNPDNNNTGDNTNGTPEDGIKLNSVPEGSVNLTLTSTMTNASGEVIATDPETGAPADPTTGDPLEPTEETPVDKVDEGAKDIEDTEDAKDVKEDADEAVEDGAEPTAKSSPSKSKKKEKDQDPDKAEDAVNDAKDVGKELGKDSEKVKKDSEKDEKQLLRETKLLEREMKRDEKLIIKMTKESLKAAKKQEELLVKYEELVADNERIAAEEESKSASAPAQQQPQQAQQNAQAAGQQGAAMMLVGGATMTDSSQNSSADNQAKMEANNQQITTISGQFKIHGNKIARNRTKIIAKQKATKTRHKKFDKKCKIRETKIKEAEKKEMEKQKRLAKQLGIVGIQENIFSIIQMTGQIMMMIVAPPWVAAAGAVLNAIGLYGLLGCGITKAIIQLANGNGMAALMTLAQTAVTFVTSKVGMGSASSNVMSMVSKGLSVVASSAEMANNVRAVQGKESSDTLSKISTIAGVASAVTGAASSFTNGTKAATDGAGNVLKDASGKVIKETTKSAFSQANKLGKVLTVAGAVGTAVSSASQLMNEFGFGDENTANLLGTIGSAINTAVSVGQALNNKQQNMEDKNDDAKEKTQDATGTDEKADKKAEKQAKKELKEEKKAEKKAEKQKAKADKKAAKEAEKAEQDKSNESATAQTQANSPAPQLTQQAAAQQQQQQQQPAAEAGIQAADKATANADKMQALETANTDSSTVVENNADAEQNGTRQNQKQQSDKTTKSGEEPKTGDDGMVKLDLQEMKGVSIEAADTSLDIDKINANMEASMQDIQAQIQAEQAKQQAAQQTAQEQTTEQQPMSEEEEINLAKREQAQKSKESKELTEADLTKTDAEGNKVRATHADGTEVTLAEARANMTVRGASKEFATMNDKELTAEITAIDAELKAAPTDQNNNGNNGQNNNENNSTEATTNSGDGEKSPEQKRAEKQARLEQLRKEQQSRKAYQTRQEKLAKHNKKESWDFAGKAMGSLAETLTKGADLFANNDEEEKKKPTAIAGGFTDHTKAIMAAHKNMMAYYGGGLSSNNMSSSDYMELLKKQQKKIDALAGRYLG